MALSRGTFVNKLDISEDHMKILGLMSRFCMVLANVKSNMQCDKNAPTQVEIGQLTTC